MPLQSSGFLTVYLTSVAWGISRYTYFYHWKLKAHRQNYNSNIFIYQKSNNFRQYCNQAMHGHYIGMFHCSLIFENEVVHYFTVVFLSKMSINCKQHRRLECGIHFAFSLQIARYLGGMSPKGFHPMMFLNNNKKFKKTNTCGSSLNYIRKA